jgi:hypothetical protein
MGHTITPKQLLDALTRDSPETHKLVQYMMENPTNEAPAIRGTWYYVDPYGGANVNDGLQINSAVADLNTAYNLCGDGAGDGIILLSGGTTSANTTSYLKQTLLWSKTGITVVGVSSGTRVFGRARIANKEVTTTSSVIAEAANTFTRDSGSFLTDGWVIGMKGSVANSGSNNAATFTVTNVTDLVMTFSETFNVQSKAQVGSDVITSSIATLITVSGNNNSFNNVHVGNFSTNGASTGCLKVTGSRNAFNGCHFIGAGHATPAATAGANDLELVGDENTFARCTFGDDTIIRASTNGNILLNGTGTGTGNGWRNRFYDCDIFSYSATAGKGAIKSGGANSCNGFIVFSRCRFFNWTPNGLTLLTSAFIGTKITSGQLLMDGCSLVGWSAWDSVAANDNVYIGNSAAVASGAGGIATSV